MKQLIHGARLTVVILVATLLAACATTEQRQIAQAVDAAHAKALAPAGSETAVLEYVRNADRMRTLRMIAYWRHRCESKGHTYRDGKCDGPTGERLAARGLQLAPEQPSQPLNEDAAELEYVQVTGSRISASDVITNNQEAGVDEGDIVKKLGRFLVVLRMGALYSINTGTAAAPELRVMDHTEVVENAQEQDIWYDEILTFDGGLMLLGYNFGSNATEVFVYGLSEEGRIERRHRFQILSEDYYSGMNYGARIRGDELVLSLSQPLRSREGVQWPKWSKHANGERQWRELVEPENLHLPLVVASSPVAHMVVRCSLAHLLDGEFQCRTAGIIGNQESMIYVTTEAAYLSVPGWEPEAYLHPEYRECWYWCGHQGDGFEKYRYTALYRIPFAEESVGVAKLRGRASAQFSFTETDEAVFVVTDEGEQSLLLQKVEWQGFGSSLDSESALVKRIPRDPSHLVIRLTDEAAWIGEHAMAMHEHKRMTGPSTLLVQPLDGGELQQLAVAHSVDRIEPFGEAIYLGGKDAHEQMAGSLVSREPPFDLGNMLVTATHSDAEHRSHAFNARTFDDGTTLLGLPGMPRDAGVSDNEWHDEVVSDLLFFEANGLALSPAGILSMQEFTGPDDCWEGYWYCYEWYGNARLFFIGERLFALSSNGLKEASYQGGVLNTVRAVRIGE